MQQSRVSIRNGRFDIPLQWGGSGPPLLFLHGAGGPALGAPFLDRLAEHFTVYAPAHPGFIGATGLEHLDDVIDLALYYHDFVDALDLDPPHVIGHSMGGMIAAEMTALSPSRFNRLVLVGPAGLWLDAHPIPDFFGFKPETLVDHAVAAPQGPLGRMLLAMWTDPNAQIELYKSMSAAAKFMWPIPDKGLKKRLHRIQQPTLVMWGAEDKLIAPIYGEHFMRAIEGARLQLMPAVGHLPMFEDEDGFVAAVTAFLSG